MNTVFNTNVGKDKLKEIVWGTRATSMWSSAAPCERATTGILWGECHYRRRWYPRNSPSVKKSAPNNGTTYSHL